jgi:hypothetical protein
VKGFSIGGVSSVSFDPTRIAAQVVTGIGFLGAGAIIRYGGSVRGLTTAAALWVTAAVGFGFWDAAIATTVVAVVALYGLKWFERKTLGRLKRGRHEFAVDALPQLKITDLAGAIESRRARIMSVRMESDDQGNQQLMLFVQLPGGMSPGDLARGSENGRRSGERQLASLTGRPGHGATSRYRIGRHAIVVVLLLVAAGASLLRRSAALLVVVAVFALALAVLDLREAVHQHRESRGALVAAATILAFAHAAAAVLAGARRSKAPANNGSVNHQPDRVLRGPTGSLLLAAQRLTMGQVNVRVTPSVSCIRETTILPRSSRLSASTWTITSYGPVTSRAEMTPSSRATSVDT